MTERPDSEDGFAAPPTPPSPALAQLAADHDVATDYWDWQGRHIQVSDDTLRAVLTSLGVDPGDGLDDDAALARDRDRAHRQWWQRRLPPIVVMRAGHPQRVQVHLPHGESLACRLVLEDGSERAVRQVEHLVEPRLIDGQTIGEAAIELDADLPLGWHLLVADAGDGSSGNCPVVVAPTRLELPAGFGEGRVWGPMTQLYQARSRRSWGVGDLADLATLSRWAAGRLGADFVLVNPLHAAEPVAPMEPSPYLPTSRRFVNPLYLRVEALSGYRELAQAERAEVDRLGAQARAANTTDTIDRDAAWAAKRAALWTIFTADSARASGSSDANFAAYLAEQGQALRDFAIWCAAAELHGVETSLWPDGLRSADPEAVSRFASDRADQVAFHSWLQWQLSQQLRRVQADTRSAGMRVGVVHDLAVGVHPDGADVWRLREALAPGVTVGAPPDQFNQLGQDWSQPPWHPERLAELGYAPYAEMLRAVLADSGGLRIDHIIGLFRLWWVPAGATAAEGTYVRYDHEALISILLLEAHRAGAVVVGEDLGVVEPFVRDYLRERGLLGTSVMWFEWGEDGLPLAPESYRDLCLATVTTHDLPPTLGYLRLAHVELRDRLGLLTRPVGEERAAESHTIDALRRMLVHRGWLDPQRSGDPAQMVLAMHRALAATPARLLGVSLSDLVGDQRIINQPGTDEEYPNWRVPLCDESGRVLLLEEVMASPLALAVAATVSAHTDSQA